MHQTGHRRLPKPAVIAADGFGNSDNAPSHLGSRQNRSEPELVLFRRGVDPLQRVTVSTASQKGTSFPTPFPATAVSAGLAKVVSRSSPKQRSPSKGFFEHRRMGSGFPSTSPVTAKTVVVVQIHFRPSPGWQGLPKHFSGFGASSADLGVLCGGPGVHRRGRGGPESWKKE